jgi:hypothetical protein
MAYKFQSGEAILSGNLKQEGTISGSGDVTLAVGKDFNIAGSNVLSLTTLGSSVVGSSLTSVGTLAGVTSSQPIVASAGLRTAQDLSASGELTLGVGGGVDIAGSTVINLTSLGSSVLASSLTSVGTLAGLTASSPVEANGGLEAGYVTSHGDISGSGDLTLGVAIDIDGSQVLSKATLGSTVLASSLTSVGTLAGVTSSSPIVGPIKATALSSSGDLQLAVGKDVNIAGSNVLNLTTLGSSVLASSLTSVGTLAGVTSSAPIVAQAGLRVSGGVISGSTGISGSSAKFSGIVNAGRFVGSGAGLTNITADQTDVTSSTGNIAYELAFTEYLGTDVGLGGNAGLAFNPRGLLSEISSSLLISGSNSGFQQSRIAFGADQPGGVTGYLKSYDDDGYFLELSAPSGEIDISGSDGVMIFAANEQNISFASQFTDNAAVLENFDEDVIISLGFDGVMSASSDLRLGAGAGIDIGGQANVLSQATLGSTVLASSLTSLGTLNGMTSSMGVQVGGYGLMANNLTRSSGDLNIKLHDAAANHVGFRLASGGFPLKVLSTGVTELNDGEVKIGASSGVISGSGDLTLGAGAGIDIGGQANVLSQATLGSTVLASSLTSVGTLVGLTSSQPIVASAGVRAIELSSSGEIQAAGAAEFNSTLSVNGAITLAGASDTAIAVGSDSIYFRDADGTMKRDSVADIVDAMAGTGLTGNGDGTMSLSSVGTVTGVGDANATLTEGLTYGSTTLTANRTWTLPASSGLSVGDVVRVKAPDDVDTFYVKITGSGAQTVDGGNPLTYLESDAAAVALHYVAANKFKIF